MTTGRHTQDFGDPMQFDRFDSVAFMRDVWQKKPLRIRDPWTAWRNPLDPEELAGLACEDGSEARLITRTESAWDVEHGPFDEGRFATLGKRTWTLLVQAVDHSVPAVAALLEPFRFIPNWRIDDVMVSYATDGGGVGPHFDQYDVFLIQGLGQRRWQVGELCGHDTALLPNDDLRLLADFVATDEWILDPGDILYLPPRIAHNGIAIGDHCMTYSIGFRAPSRSELLSHFCDHLLAEMVDDDRYADANLATQANPGEIATAAIARLHAMITEKMDDRDAFARWFGQYTSTPKYFVPDQQLDVPIGVEAIRRWIGDRVPVVRDPASRFSFIRKKADAVSLFVDGQIFECVAETAALARDLCAQDRVMINPALTKSGSAMALLVQLAAQGSLAFNDDD